VKIAINGAGIAGPALAFWLRKCNHDVLLIEQAPDLRTGGYVIDFWGLGYDIAEKMGIIPRVRELGYQVEEVRYVDRDGETAGGFSVDVFSRATNGRFTSVRRSDLARTLYETLDEKVETIFGDSIASIHEQEDCVRIGFENAPEREVDLVIGADGLHSAVRRIVFGTVDEYPLGLHVAAFEVEGYEPRDELIYVTHGRPGRDISRFTLRDNRTMFLFLFRTEHMPGGTPISIAERKAVLRHVYGDVGWECPRILAEMERAADLYFDRVSQIRMDRWSSGRTALVGDAGACVSLLAGEGTGLAMAEAYVLAGELGQCDGDYAAAFARYEARMGPFLKQKQASAERFIAAFAPRTAFGQRFRNIVTRLMRFPAVADYFVGRELRDDIVLPDYSFGTARR
jgi:2-polyprenyl-6-methoxyphenol hydroxylase-like FAD-dependent oxidoreductase